MKDLSIDEIKQLAIKEFGFNIFSKTREEQFVYARFITFKLANQLGHSQNKISISLKYNNSTIINGLKQFDVALGYSDYKKKYKILQFKTGLIKDLPIEKTNNSNIIISKIIGKLNDIQRKDLVINHLLPFAKSKNLL
jgi:hypothetical protein